MWNAVVCAVKRIGVLSVLHLGDLRPCEGGSSPSDYVSLGMAGQVALDAGVDLQGCTVNIIELDGGSTPNESYSVYLCPTDTLDDTCLGGAPIATSPDTGGAISVEIPAAEEPAGE